MLQKPGDRIDISGFREEIRRLEERARRVAERIGEVLAGSRDLIVAYYRQGYLPASILYWMTSTLDDWRKVLLGEAGTLAYYALVYGEPATTVFYTTMPRSSATIQFLQAASLTGYKVNLFAVEPDNPVVRDTLQQYGPYYIHARNELEASLLYALATYIAASKHYRDKLGRRGKRLYQHSVEGFAVIVEELLEKYMDVLRSITRLGEARVSAPRMLEASALYMVEALRRRGIRAFYEPIEYLTGPGEIVLLSTSVDEYLVRERRFHLNMTGAHVHDIVVNTDPLEAQLYFALLAYFIAL